MLSFPHADPDLDILVEKLTAHIRVAFETHPPPTLPQGLRIS